MNTSAIYTSKCMAKSFWQKYEIFDDRVELHTWLGNIAIPFDQIEAVEVLPPLLRSLRFHLQNCLFALKLDPAELNEHILLDKQKGFMRQILFTPENPEEFKRVLDEAITRFRESLEGAKDAE